MGILKKSSGGASCSMVLMLLAVIASWGAVTALVFIFSARTPDPDMMSRTGLIERIALISAGIAVLLALLGIFGNHLFSGVLGLTATVMLAALVFLALNGYIKEQSAFVDEAAQRYQAYKQTSNAAMPIQESDLRQTR